MTVRFSILLAVLLGATVLGVAGCDKKVEPPKPAQNEPQGEVLRRLQEPQQRAREMEQQLLERDRQQRQAIDQAS